MKVIEEFTLMAGSREAARVGQISKSPQPRLDAEKLPKQ